MWISILIITITQAKQGIWWCGQLNSLEVYLWALGTAGSRNLSAAIGACSPSLFGFILFCIAFLGRPFSCGSFQQFWAYNSLLAKSLFLSSGSSKNSLNWDSSAWLDPHGQADRKYASSGPESGSTPGSSCVYVWGQSHTNYMNCGRAGGWSGSPKENWGVVSREGRDECWAGRKNSFQLWQQSPFIV